MAHLFLTPINLNKNELQNAVMQNLATAPGSPVEGLVYYDTVDHRFYVYNGTGWEALDNDTAAELLVKILTVDGAASGLDADLLDGQHGSYYLDRANHTGTQTASTISDFDTQVQTNQLDEMAAPTTAVSMNSQKITSLGTPTSGTDAATKQYVDDLSAGLKPKDSARVATTVAGTLASSFENGDTVDGVTLVTGDRILIKNQADETENGIYVVAASGAPARSGDANTGAELGGGSFIFVQEGTTQADTGWVAAHDGIPTLGADDIIFVQFSSAGIVAAGDGLTKTGNTIDVVTADAGRIVVNANSIDLATAGTPGTYTSVTTDAYGRVTSGGDIVSANGIVTRTAAGTYTNRTITGTTNVIDVTNGDGVSGNPTITIAATYIGQTSITTLGTIGTGTWQGTAVGVTYGGTGATTAAGARTAIGALGRYSATIGDNSSTTITITQATHGMAANGTNTVAVYDATSGAQVHPDVTVAPGSGNVTLGFSVAPTTNQYRVVIQGLT